MLKNLIEPRAGRMTDYLMSSECDEMGYVRLKWGQLRLQVNCRDKIFTRDDGRGILLRLLNELCVFPWSSRIKIYSLIRSFNVHQQQGMSGHEEIHKYLLKRITSKKTLKEEVSTPTTSLMEHDRTTSSNKDSFYSLERKVAELEAENQQLRSEVSRLVFIQEEAAECRKEIQQLEIEKDFYMRAYKALKKDYNEVYKEAYSTTKDAQILRERFRERVDSISDWRQNTHLKLVIKPKDSKEDTDRGRQRSIFDNLLSEKLSFPESPYHLNTVRSAQELLLASSQQIHLPLETERAPTSSKERSNRIRDHLKTVAWESPKAVLKENPYGFISRSKEKIRQKGRF